MTLSNDDYVQTQHQISLLAGMLKELPLGDFLDRLSHAEALGAVMDPTLYREALTSGKLDLIRESAQALKDAQGRIAKAETRYRTSQEPS